MKLVCASDFRNIAPDKIIIEDALHELHVHKGARFEIGGETPFDKLQASDKRLVVELNSAGRIVSEDQTDAVKKIDAEVAQAKKAAEARQAKPDAKK